MDKFRTAMIALIIVLMSPVTARAEASSAEVESGSGPDLSRWRCRFCAFESGLDGRFGLGIGLAFDDAYRFGTGTGLDSEGAFLSTTLSLTKWGEGASYYTLEAGKLGTDAGGVFLDGGVQGKYRLRLSYDQTPYRLNNSGASPFLGVGTGNLSLPGSWQTTGNARLMPDLAATLKNVAIGHDRKTMALGIEFGSGHNWTHALQYRRRDKDGLQPYAGGFLTLSTVLPAPIDYQTDLIQASTAYTAANWQARLGYYGSFFSNANPLLQWDNPFNPLVAGADQGVLARPPDNDFHQFSLAGNYRWGRSTRLTGNIALGKATQNEPFAPYTVNTQLAGTPLPAASADARLDSTLFSGAARLNGKLSRKLNFKAYVRKQERDNKTPIYALQPVITDVYQSGTRFNRPFSFDKSQYGLDLRYRLTGPIRVSAGLEREDYERDFQEVRKTTEDKVWLKLSAQSGEVVGIGFSLRREDRDGSGYRPVSMLDPPENPLLRKFNLADRKRDLVSANIDVDPHPSLSLSLRGDYSSDEYPQSVVGLNESTDRTITLDASYSPNARISTHGFVSRQTIDYLQTGDSGSLWQGTGEDRFVTGGFGIDLRSEDNQRQLQFQYTRSDSTGKSAIAPGTTAVAFPDLSADLETISISFISAFHERYSAKMRYQYERYHSRDWSIEGVSQATIGSVLTLGEFLPNYTQQVLWLEFVRNF